VKLVHDVEIDKTFNLCPKF